MASFVMSGSNCNSLARQHNVERVVGNGVATGLVPSLPGSLLGIFPLNLMLIVVFRGPSCRPAEKVPLSFFFFF